MKNFRLILCTLLVYVSLQARATSTPPTSQDLNPCSLAGVRPPLVLPDVFSVPGVTYVGRIGGGGMGDVYEAVYLDPSTGTARRMALKVALAGHRDAANRRALEREARITEKVTGKAPQWFLDVDGNLLGVGFELITWTEAPNSPPAERLADWLDRKHAEIAAGGEGARKADLEIRRAAFGLLREIEKLAKIGVVHGDLKPHNILIDSKGRVQIIDYGLALQVPGAPSNEGPLRRMLVNEAPHTHGTPGYLGIEAQFGRVISPFRDVEAFRLMLLQDFHRGAVGPQNRLVLKSAVARDAPELLEMMREASADGFVAAYAKRLATSHLLGPFKAPKDDQGRPLSPDSPEWKAIRETREYFRMQTALALADAGPLGREVLKALAAEGRNGEQTRRRIVHDLDVIRDLIVHFNGNLMFLPRHEMLGLDGNTVDKITALLAP